MDTSVSTYSRLPRAAVKVPEITVLFWVIKILTTGMGEAASDWLSRADLALAGVAGVGGFAIAMWLQFRTDRYRPVVYWFAVAMVALFGTMVADGLHRARSARPREISPRRRCTSATWSRVCSSPPSSRSPRSAGGDSG